MAVPSTFSTIVFGLTVGAVALLFVRAMRHTMPAGNTRWLSVLLVLVMWIGIPGVLARAGLLDRYAPLPAPPLMLIAVLTAGTIVLALSPIGTRMAKGLPLVALIGFQVFRLPVEWWLHRLFSEGVIPVEMTYSGRNFDIVTGISAAALALFVAGGRKAPRLVLLWNVLGLALLVNIVTVAVLSTPSPFRHFTNGPPNLLPSTFPFIWLPSFLVQAALFGHLMVFRKVLRAGEVDA